MRTQIAVLALVTLPGVCLAEIITNGGFETGDFTGWTLSGNTSDTFVDGTLPHSGLNAANLGPSPTDGMLAQLLPTIPGQIYTLSYWLQNEGGSPNDFSVSWDGGTLPGSVLTDSDPGFEYTLFTFQNLVATPGRTPLEFTFEQTPAFWHLDDVSVSVQSAPEPASLTICAAMLAGLGLMKLLRRSG
ncbi:MAG TPA: hypothetical protein VE959_03580 [Bryobacteraceae bacterium]|nr:hypothetical protein [Bryobacteraceae bacterium]